MDSAKDERRPLLDTSLPQESSNQSVLHCPDPADSPTSTAAGNVIDSEPRHLPPPYYGSQDPPRPQRAIVSGPGGVMMMNTGPAMGTKPTNYTCPSCHARIITYVEPKVTTRTHTFAFLFCIFGCLPCIAIPYFVDSCKNMDHYCPECSAYIGSYVH